MRQLLPKTATEGWVEGKKTAGRQNNSDGLGKEKRS
jgi:hypothetical protein